MAESFCPTCGKARDGSARFCGSCGHDFEATTNVQANVAAGLYQLEQLRIKLIVGRLLTMSAALVLWWNLAPRFGGDPIWTFGSLIVALFGGLWVGTMLTLAVVRR